MIETILKKGQKKDAFIAILRGIKPHECLDIAHAIFECGIDSIELPLMPNEKDALDSIERLCHHFPDQSIGAGTVLTTHQVQACKDAGAQYIVSPNLNKLVIQETHKLGLSSIPGVLTPSEAFQAVEYGANALKIFPMVMCPPNAIKSLVSVLPPNTALIPTGSVQKEQLIDYFHAGASKIGLGSMIYKQGDDAQSVHNKIKAIQALL